MNVVVSSYPEVFGFIYFIFYLQDDSATTDDTWAIEKSSDTVKVLIDVKRTVKDKQDVTTFLDTVCEVLADSELHKDSEKSWLVVKVTETYVEMQEQFQIKLGQEV